MSNSQPVWLADISNWQAGINIEQVVREGYAAVVCKATEGGTFNDKQFDNWIPRIRKAGAIPGAYHYLRAGNGAAQARHFLNRLKRHGGPDGMLIQLDNEKDASWDTTKDWVKEWNRLTGNHPILMYTGAWWWKPRGWDGEKLTPYLWHSRYVNGTGTGSKLYEKVPASWWTPGYGGWDKVTVLQFSSKGKVAGKQIDVNAFRGTLAQLRALTRPASNPSPSPQPGKPALKVDGALGKDTITRWQKVMGTPVDGVISRPSELTTAVQKHLNAKIRAGLDVDGLGIAQDGKSSDTIRALQRYLDTPVDGVLSPGRSECVEALQKRLNSGKF